MPFLALALSLFLSISPQAGYAPLRVATSVRLTGAEPDSSVCIAWQNDAGQEHSIWAEEHLSCQPVIPPWTLYQSALLLSCGTWTIRAVLLVRDDVRYVSPAKSVRVLSGAGERRPCDVDPSP